MVNQKYIKQIQHIVDYASEAMKGTIYFSLILNYMMQASLSAIFMYFEILQLIVLIPLFQIILPANAASFFNILMQIAAFDFLDIIEPMSWIFNAEETNAINNNFKALGFDSL